MVELVTVRRAETPSASIATVHRRRGKLSCAGSANSAERLGAASRAGSHVERWVVDARARRGVPRVAAADATLKCAGQAYRVPAVAMGG